MLSIVVSISALLICVAAGFLIDAENYAAINIFLGIVALVAAGVVVGSLLHHLSQHSHIKNAFHAFTLFVITRIAIIFTGHYYGGHADFLEIFEDMFATGHFVMARRFSSYVVSAFDLNILAIMLCTGFCYLYDDNKIAQVVPFLWVFILLVMVVLGFIILLV